METKSLTDLTAAVGRRRAASRSYYLLAVAVSLFLVALFVRLERANEPPLNFHATRQYRSLIIARDLYYQNSPTLPAWQREVAHISAQRQGTLEPPIMEALVATIYRPFGEQLWIAPLLSSLFWLFGGWFLWLIARRMFGEAGALFSVAFYLFLPFAVVASRSFQPDPLMIMLMLAAVYAIQRYLDAYSGRALVATTVLSALAFFVKPVSVFAVVATMVAGSIHRLGLRRTFSRPSLWGYVLAALLPTAGFYLYGILGGGLLRTQAQSSFLPGFLLDPSFWKSWLTNAGAVVGYPALVLALVGVLLCRDGLSRALLIGMWSGYALFCLAFDYTISAHDYYHLQLVPIVALSLGPIAALLWDRGRETVSSWAGRVAVVAIVLLAAALNLSESRARTAVSPEQLRAVTVAEEVGEMIGHSTRTVFLSGDYGLPLEFHGRVAGLSWPLLSDLEWERLAGREDIGAEARFQELSSALAPEYFVVLDRGEFEGQPDLANYLTSNHPVLAQAGDYLVFDLRRGRDGSDGR